MDMACDCPYRFDSLHQRWVYTIVHEPPQYPSGEMGMLQTIMRHLQWPGQDYCITGRVVVSIIVEKDGSIADKQIARSFNPGIWSFDAAVLAAMEHLKSWQPGRCEGELVPVRVLFPIRIYLR